MRNIVVVAVEPLYANNIGYISRVMKNFDINELRIVNPRCDPKSLEAIKFSKHGNDIIKRAKIYKDIKTAIKGYTPIGTTALWHKTEKSKFNVYEIKTALKIIKPRETENIAIILGRDDTGLTKDELSMFPINIYIKTYSNYQTLNISHALAIILYEFKNNSNKDKAEYGSDSIYASNSEINQIKKQLSIYIKNNDIIRKKEDVLKTFIRVISRSKPTKIELNTISSLFSIKKRNKKS